MTPEEQDKLQTMAKTLFKKGQFVHKRIERLIKQTMIQEDAPVMNLTIAQMEVIMSIYKAGALSLTELSNSMKVSPPSTSVMVDKLVEKKFLIRQRDKNDRRKVLIRVSKEMKRHMERVETAIIKMFEQLILKVGSDVTDMWCQVLSAVDSSLEELCFETQTALEN